MRKRAWMRWLLLSLAIIVADQASKAAIIARLRDGSDIALAPFLSLILAFNAGAAFSFLNDASGWQHGLFVTIACIAAVVIVWLLRRGGSTVYCAGLALILGGALGNLMDRVEHGRVVDFLYFHYGKFSFPAFNVADSAITVGAALLILDSFRTRHASDARAALPAADPERLE